VSIKDRAFNYGDGLFETIYVKNNKPLFLDAHIKRLNIGCDKLSIPIISRTLLKDTIKKSILKSKECIVKIIYSRGLSEHGYQFGQDITPQLYVFKKNINKRKKNKFVSLGYSKYLLKDNLYLSKIKHLNRIEQILGLTKKGVPSYDTYIMLDSHKKIIECISSNIFFYNYKINTFNFVTPSLDTCGVEGIMKQQIIKYLKSRKIKIFEKGVSKKDIIKFDGCFICNVVNGVQFVKKIEEKSINHIFEIESLLKKYIYE